MRSPRHFTRTGALSGPHKMLGKDCSACHEKAFVSVRDETCLSCHENTNHHADAHGYGHAAHGHGHRTGRYIYRRPDTGV